jgi:effector-binding domain-containing protein
LAVEEAHMTEAIGTRPALTPEIVELPARSAAVVRIEGPVSDMPSMMGEAFDLTMKAITASGASYAGHPFARYVAFGPQIEAEVGFPFSGTVNPTDRVYICELPGGRTVTTTHVGPYDQIGEAWERVQAWMKDHGLESKEPPWEAYLTGPEDPGPPITEIFFPIR